MSSSPTAPTSTTGSSTSSPSEPPDGARRAHRLRRARPAGGRGRRAPRLAGRRAPAAAAAAQPAAPDRRRGPRAGRPAAAVVRPGRGGVRRLRHLRRPRRGLRASSGCARLPGLHCYDLYAGASRASSGFFDEQPGHLPAHRLPGAVVRPHRGAASSGLDRWPELRDDLLRPLHAGGLAGPGARRRAARAGRSTRPTGSGLPLTVVETGDAARRTASRQRARRRCVGAAACASGVAPAAPAGRVRQASVSAIWLKVKTCRPSTSASRARRSAGAHFSRNRSPVKPPGAASRAKVPLCLARNRVDSPTPILVAIAEQLGRARPGPGMPSSSGIVIPRPRIRRDPGRDDVGVEGQVADDVGGVAALVPHRLDGEVVVDRRVRLGVAGDADVRERPARASARSSSRPSASG